MPDVLDPATMQIEKRNAGKRNHTRDEEEQIGRADRGPQSRPQPIFPGKMLWRWPPPWAAVGRLREALLRRSQFPIQRFGKLCGSIWAPIATERSVLWRESSRACWETKSLASLLQDCCSVKLWWININMNKNSVMFFCFFVFFWEVGGQCPLCSNRVGTSYFLPDNRRWQIEVYCRHTKKKKKKEYYVKVTHFKGDHFHVLTWNYHITWWKLHVLGHLF